MHYLQLTLAEKETLHFSSLRRRSEAECLFTNTPRGSWETETGSGTKDDGGANSCGFSVIFLLTARPSVCTRRFRGFTAADAAV